MHKVHGAPLETGFEPRRGYLTHPVMGPLVVSLALLLVLCAVVFFRSLGAS